MDISTLDNYSEIVASGRKMLSLAYAPYSDFPVGAVVLTKDGQLFTGCNIENTSYSLTVCAEVAAISAMVTAGIQEIHAMFVFSNTSQFVTPCGACRQKILEFAKSDISIFLINTKSEIRQHSLSTLIPMAFDLESMSET